jgi:hypothetical protein
VAIGCGEEVRAASKRGDVGANVQTLDLSFGIGYGGDIRSRIPDDKKWQRNKKLLLNPYVV